jgi:hypothetical protein
MDRHPILHPLFASVFCLTSEMLNGPSDTVVFHQSWPWLTGVVLVHYSVILVLGDCIVIVENNLSHVPCTVNSASSQNALKVHNYVHSRA